MALAVVHGSTSSPRTGSDCSNTKVESSEVFHQPRLSSAKTPKQLAPHLVDLAGRANRMLARRSPAHGCAVELPARATEQATAHTATNGEGLRLAACCWQEANYKPPGMGSRRRRQLQTGANRCSIGPPESAGRPCGNGLLARRAGAEPPHLARRSRNNSRHASGIKNQLACL
jgi:hypothetical protein